MYTTGEKARVALAIFALVPRNLLLLDEVSLYLCLCLSAGLLAQLCVSMCCVTSCVQCTCYTARYLKHHKCCNIRLQVPVQ
jgi:ABC-type transport system involved in cytochrome c biogenesis ATPase subunit